MQPHSISRITPTKEEKDSAEMVLERLFSLGRQGNPTFILRILICAIPLSKVESRPARKKFKSNFFLQIYSFPLYLLGKISRKYAVYALQSNFLK
jgi:hypothetical protein